MPALGQLGRAAAICCCLIAFAGLFVWGGAASPEPPSYDNPSNVAVVPSPDAYVGEAVTLYGTVVATDPVVVRATSDDASIDITLRGADATHATGDEVMVVGTLRDDRTLAVDRIVDRDRVADHEPWEYGYLLGVSLLGALWILGRVARQWRIDRTAVALTPRADDTTDGEADA